MRADHLDGSLVKLRQIAAGHFAFCLLPPRWSLPGALRWRKVGQDGVVEVQVSSKDWLSRKLEAQAISKKAVHEHLLMEQGMQPMSLILLCSLNLLLRCLWLMRLKHQDLLVPLHQRRHRLLQAHLGRVPMPREGCLPGNVAKAVQRWSRMLMRLQRRALWHAHGVLLWLLRRPFLRFLPVPYPSVTRVDQWILQAEQMVASHVWPKRWIAKSKSAGGFVMNNLSELAGFRSRLGMKLSFLEDPLLQGMLAARHLKGAQNAMKRAVMEDAKKQAAEEAAAGRTKEAIRTLIGPRGGLPSLKSDLLRLAALLQIQVTEKMTVEELKTLCKPII